LELESIVSNLALIASVKGRGPDSFHQSLYHLCYCNSHIIELSITNYELLLVLLLVLLSLLLSVVLSVVLSVLLLLGL